MSLKSAERAGEWPHRATSFPQLTGLKPEDPALTLPESRCFTVPVKNQGVTGYRWSERK